MKKDTLRYRYAIALIATLAVFLLTPAAWAATYYVDAVNGADSNNGLATTTAWKTIAKVNASAFQPGDQILFNSGKIWREQLNIPSAGTSGNPITFGVYGSGAKPIINGADLVTGTWTQYSGTIYSIALSTQPKRVWWGTTELANNASGYQSLAANQFNYSAGYLYVNVGKNPTGETIEAAKRQYCVYWNKSYVTIDGLHLTKANNCGITQWSAKADYGTVRNCLIDYVAIQGLYTGQSASINTANWVVENNTFDHCGTDNVLHHGIYTKWALNWLIQGNTYTNGQAFAINLNGSSRNIVRYNVSTGQHQGFVQFFEDTAGGSQYNQVYYNISNGDGRLVYLGGGPNHIGNVVYNNTAYNFTYAGIDLEANNVNLTVKNNILWSSVPNVQIYKVDTGSALSSTSNNNLGPLGTSGIIRYRGTAYSTLAAFKSAFPNLDTNSISAAPLFVSSGSDFHLTAKSPCINAGVNVSLTQDYSGQPVSSSSAPTIGAYEYQTISLAAPTNLRLL
jgi:hypothetical protein